MVNAQTLNEEYSDLSPEQDIERAKKNVKIDDKTKSALSEKHKRNITNQAFTNIKIEEKIKRKELDKKLEEVSSLEIGDILRKAKSTYSNLLNASLVSTVLFTLISFFLIVVHTMGVGNTLIKLGTEIYLAYSMSFVLAGVFEIIMITFVMDYKHTYANLAMISAMATLITIAVIEYAKSDVVAIQTILRMVSGIALVPLVKGLVASARDALSGKNKKLFEELKEKQQKELMKIISNLTSQRDLLKANKIKKEDIAKSNFKEMSNTFKIKQESLRDILVKNNIYDNKFFKEIPIKRKVTKTPRIEPNLLKEMIEHVDHYKDKNLAMVGVAGLDRTFLGRGLNKQKIVQFLYHYYPDLVEKFKEEKEKNKKEKVKKN